MTCGQGLAQHADVPLQVAELIAALAETLELHRAMLRVEDPNSKKEDGVYHELAEKYRDVAGRLDEVARQMAMQRDLPMGAHDESKWGSAHLASFERFVRAEAMLARIVSAAAERDLKMLEAMTAPAVSTATAASQQP